MKPSRVLAVILVVLAFPVSVWAQDVISGCKKINNGQVRIIAEGQRCLPSEQAIQLSAKPASGTLPATSPAAGPMTIADTDGNTLGLFVPGSSMAARQAGDLWVGIPVIPTGFLPSSPFAFYQTAGCDGDAYLPIDTNSFLRAGYVAPGQTGQPTFFYPGKPEVDASTIVAVRYAVGDTLACFSYSEGPYTLFGKMASIDLSMYNAPFKIVQ